MIEMCKNEIDQGRCRFLQQKAQSEGTNYKEPYQALSSLLKQQRHISLFKPVNGNLYTISMKILYLTVFQTKNAKQMK